MDNNTQPPHQPAKEHRPSKYLSGGRQSPEKDQANRAANLIRGKLDSLYAGEPDAKTEIVEAAEAANSRSKHQQFMYELSHSGKSMAEIQIAWHHYYDNLPDDQKLEVWREFYASTSQTSHFIQARRQQPSPQSFDANAPDASSAKPLVEPYLGKSEQTDRHIKPKANKHREHLNASSRTVADIKQQLLGHLQPRRKLKARQHLQSLMFGLGLGAFVLLIMLFGLFNERVIAPLITPSRQVSSTPIIINPDDTTVSSSPEIIIPKINVEIPVVYSQTSINEDAIEGSLEQGVVHYPTTPYPGQMGNTVIFGHSSNNIFNPGKYKFAFVLLSRLSNGDLFYLTNNGKEYAYQVYKKEIVDPTDVNVLGPADKPATATLITCDPPGTSIHRLVVIGQQITPSPTADVASTAIHSTQKPTILPSNSPSLWSRIVKWF